MFTWTNGNLGRVVLSLIVFALASAAWAATAHAEPVAMVTDIQGKVAAQSGPRKGEMTILTEIDPGTRVQIDGSARLVVIYLKPGDEYAMSGPGLIEFRANAPVAVSGATPAKRANPLGKASPAIRIKPVGVTQGALVMRSARPAARIKLLNLAGTQTLDLSPEFRWQGAEPGLRYQFELNDETGRALFEVQVEGVALKLPPSVELKEGTGYTWTVSARLSDGRRYMNSGDFSIAPADLRARVETIRPASAAPVSERVAFAAWLEQMELKDEARKTWRAIYAERPEDARLRALAAE